MLLSTSNRDKLARRREVEKYLFNLGMSQRDIGTTLGIDTGSVRNDYNRIMGKEKFKFPELSLTERRNKTFGDALRMYAKLEKMKLGQELSRDLRKALETYLDVQRLLGIADGIAGIIWLMASPPDPEEFRSYRRLLRALFGVREMEMQRLLESEIFSSYLEYICIPEMNPPNRRNIADAMAKWAFSEYGQGFAIPLNATIKRAMGQVLNTLTPREEKILCMRFGLDRPNQMTLGEIATYYGGGIAQGGIRSIEIRALCKLRNPVTSSTLRIFVDTAENHMRNFLESRFPESPPPTLPLP